MPSLKFTHSTSSPRSQAYRLSPPQQADISRSTTDVYLTFDVVSLCSIAWGLIKTNSTWIHCSLSFLLHSFHTPHYDSGLTRGRYRLLLLHQHRMLSIPVNDNVHHCRTKVCCITLLNITSFSWDILLPLCCVLTDVWRVKLSQQLVAELQLLHVKYPFSVKFNELSFNLVSKIILLIYIYKAEKQEYFAAHEVIHCSCQIE